MAQHTDASQPNFRQRLARGELLAGTFIKTPTTHGIEIVGALGYDFVVIDAEHGALDRAAIDSLLLATRAAGTAGLVRVSSVQSGEIGSALDCGAVGVLAPHIASVEQAQALVHAGRFERGRRGYSGSTRASDYGGAALWASVSAQDARTCLIAMIEDREALDHIEAIAQVEGIDALFIGRADLALALKASAMDAPVLTDAVARIIAAGRAAGRPICMMVGNAAEAQAMRAQGASAFIIGSDQGFLRKAAHDALNGVRQLG